MAASDLIILISTPFILALVGGLTNLVGLALAFFPLRFVGIRPYLGWQGIIPSKAEAITGKAFDLLTSRLQLIETILERLDAEALADDVMPSVQRILDDAIEEVLTREIPVAWSLIQGPIRHELQRRIRREAKPVVAQVVREIKADIHSAVDLRRIVVEAVTSDRRLLNRIFFRAGRAELKLLVVAGFAFGALYGVAEMALAALIHPHPLFYVFGGLLAGLLTSASSLWWLFNPVTPVVLGGHTFQGLFPRRQKAVAAELARFATEEVVDLPRIVRLLFKGPSAHVLGEIIERNIKLAFDSFTGENQRTLRKLLGRQSIENIPKAFAEEFTSRAHAAGRHALPYLSNAIALESLLRVKIEELPPQEYLNILRPVFHDEEYKLILGAGAVGLIVGSLQAIALYALQNFMG